MKKVELVKIVAGDWSIGDLPEAPWEAYKGWASSLYSWGEVYVLAKNAAGFLEWASAGGELTIAGSVQGIVRYFSGSLTNVRMVEGEGSGFSLTHDVAPGDLIEVHSHGDWESPGTFGYTTGRFLGVKVQRVGNPTTLAEFTVYFSVIQKTE